MYNNEYARAAYRKSCILESMAAPLVAIEEWKNTAKSMWRSIKRPDDDKDVDTVKMQLKSDDFDSLVAFWSL